MHAITSKMSCGVLLFYELWASVTIPIEKIIELFKTPAENTRDVWGPAAGPLPPMINKARFAVFSDIFYEGRPSAAQPLHRSPGEKFAKYLEESGWFEVTRSSPAVNPNSGNLIVVWTARLLDEKKAA